MDENKRDLANKELSDTSLKSSFLDTVFPASVSLPEDAPYYEQNVNSQNNYNVTINLNGEGQKPSKQEVNNVVNKIVNNEIINSPEELKKNSQEDFNPTNGSSENVVVVSESKSDTAAPVLPYTDLSPEAIPENPTAPTPQSQTSSDTIGVEISPPHEPFYVTPPLTFDLDYFGEVDPAEYSKGNIIEKNNSSLLSYETVRNIIERSIQPVSSGALGKSILSDEYNAQIQYVENLVNIQEPENQVYNDVANQSLNQEFERHSREQDNRNNLKDISNSMATQSKSTNMKEMSGGSMVQPVQMSPLAESNFKLYSGETTLGLFAKEKNSPPSWRTVTS